MQPGSRDTWSVSTRSASATRRFARELARRLRGGTVLALVGELGAGKTSFVQGLAEGLGVAAHEVVSPTYTLVNEYPAGERWLVHVDLYRLSDAQSVHELGIEEHFHRRDAVVAVEWADRLPEIFPPDAVWIELGHAGGNARTIQIRGLAPA